MFSWLTCKNNFNSYSNNSSTMTTTTSTSTTNSNSNNHDNTKQLEKTTNDKMICSDSELIIFMSELLTSQLSATCMYAIASSTCK